MAAALIVEVRKATAEKWESYGSFNDFDTCLTHIKKLAQNSDHVVRLVVPGGFNLDQEDKDALAALGVQHNT